MDEGATNGVTAIVAVEREVEALRLRAQALIEELERRMRRAKEATARVRRLIDWSARARRHPRAAVGIGLVVAAVVGAAWWMQARRRRDRRSLVRLRRALRG